MLLSVTTSLSLSDVTLSKKWFTFYSRPVICRTNSLNSCFNYLLAIITFLKDNFINGFFINGLLLWQIMEFSLGLYCKKWTLRSNGQAVFKCSRVSLSHKKQIIVFLFSSDHHFQEMKAPKLSIFHFLTAWKTMFSQNTQHKYQIVWIFCKWRKYHIFCKTKIQVYDIFSAISDSFHNKSKEQNNDKKWLED